MNESTLKNNNLLFQENERLKKEYNILLDVVNTINGLCKGAKVGDKYFIGTLTNSALKKIKINY